MRIAALCLGLVLLLAGTPVQAGPRLDAIKARGALHCGVAANEPGMSVAGAGGNYIGFEADLCRAIAIAIFGTPKLVFKPTTTLQDFLRGDDVDLVIRGLSWSFQRETNSNIRFGPIYYHDGQTFLVRGRSGISNIAALSGRTICVSSDTFADFYPALERTFRARNLNLRAQRTHTRAEAEQMFFAGSCDAVTADATELASAALAHGPSAEVFNILEEQITKEPLAPLLRKGDEEFFQAVRWAMFALINAEELGLTSRNIDAMRGSADADVKAFLAAPPPVSGLSANWTYAIVKTIGNYGEVFGRHFEAARSNVNIPRGLNRLWTQGGILYAPPIR